MSGRSVAIPIQFITERGVNEAANDVKERIRSLIRSELAPIALSLSVTSIDRKKLNDDEYESSQVVRLRGKIVVPGSAPSAGRSFVRKFVSVGQKSLCMSVNPSTPEEDVVFDPLSLLESTQITEIKDFHLGSRVGYTDFVSHFDAKKIKTPAFKMKNLTASFEHDLSKFHINFFNRDIRSKFANVGTNYELRIKYDSVSAVTIVPIPGPQEMLRVYFVLKFPPSLFEMVITETDAREKISKSFCRAVTFPVPLSDGGISKQDFGRCNVLAIDFPMIGNEAKVKEMKSTYQKAVVEPWHLVSNFKRFTDYTNPIPFYFACVNVHDGSKIREQPLTQLFREEWFPILYAIKSCMSVSHQLNDDLCVNGQWDAFLSSVMEKCECGMQVLEKAIFDLFKILERNSAVSVLLTFNDIHAFLVHSNYTDYTCVKGIRKIRRAVLTPTHMILLPPHPFVESRLMRVCEPDFALRCHVRDDDDYMLTYTMGVAAPERQREFLMRHIRDPVITGIMIGHRAYRFLGSSSSQLRDHGFILYAEDVKSNDANYYRKAIGDFSRILCVGKYIARVGQSFSQMLESVVIDSAVMPQKIPDVKGGRHPQSGNPYVFTDGVGVVSAKLAQKFAERLGMESVPSAFQIRYKGCKGLVVVDNCINENIEFLGYRESMDKFPCDSDTLEILKYSCPRPVYLNRPLITLLDQLGTPLNTFERLLADHLTKLIKAFLDEDSAIECIRSYCPQIFRLMKFELIHKSGLSILSEPFFRKVLDIIIRKKIRELKKKARIQVPYNEGRIMFGVADEYQVLEYGQIFVQYTNSSGERKVLTGEVMVTKYPCMHPGDVRKFMAIDRPELRHIVDCIVFPTKGHRPHPNEMAGSDLDGDEYSVIWMKDLYFRKPTQPAMIFSDEKAEELSRPVEVSDIMDFFCEFIRTNVVGLIANAHLAIADTQSIFHPKCLDLCEKYSQALDFAKTGRNTELPPEDRPKHYPDFMEKGAERSTYKSDQALGTVFRWIDVFEKAINDSTREADPNHIPNPRFQCEGWQEFEEIAMDDFEKYKMTCECLLKELSIESEESLLSSICERNGKFASGKKEDMQEMLERIVKDTFEGFRQRFEENTKSESDRQKKAVAYYMTARVKQESMPGKKWYGFPWIASQELATLIQRKEVDKNLQEVTIATLINSILPPAVGKHFDPYSRAKGYLSNWVETNPLRKVRLRFDTEEELALIDEKLRLMRISSPVSGDQLSGFSPTAGEIIVSTLKQLIMDMMLALKNNGQVKSTLKLGIAAMISLNKCFRTGKVDCLTSSSSNVPIADANELKLNRFHISLSILRAEAFTNLVERHHDKVLKYLQRHSNVKYISARMVSQYNYRYWLVSALGDEWSLANLSNLLVQQDFYTSTTTEIQNLIQNNNSHRRT